MRDKETSSTLISRLKGTLTKQRLVGLTGGLVATLVALIAGSILLSLLAGVMVLPVWLKVSLLSLMVAVVGYLFVKYGLARLWRGDIDSMAVRLEEKHPNLKGRLIAAIQFARMKDKRGFSSDLIAMTERQALDRSGKLNFNEAVSLYPVMKTARVLAVASVVAIAMLVLAPGLFTYSYEVYSNPTEEIAPPLGYRLTPFPGSVEWVKYRDIEIGGVLYGDRFPEDAVIHYRLVGGGWQQTEVELARINSAGWGEADSMVVSTKLRQINKSFDYFVEAGRLKTEIQKVDVVDRPRVEGIKLSIFYPEYTEMPPSVIDENNGSFSAVVGSRVNMQIETNLPVESAMLVFEDSSKSPMKITGKAAETALKVDSSRAYYVRLTDHLGEENPDPIEYYVTAIPDEYPSIDVLSPGFDVNLGDEMILPLKVRIFDDFGFSSLVLKYSIFSQRQMSEEHVAVLHFSDRIKTEGDVSFNWDMDQFSLYPGDYVLYHLELADNDRVTGPKVTSTRQYVARLPSLEEIIAQTETAGIERISRTEDLLKTGKEIAERMKNVARKLQAQQKDVRKTDWQHQKEISSVADKNAQLLKEIEKSAEQMEESVDKMAENSFLSREIMEKLAQIQKLFEEVATPEMKAAQQKLMEALQNMDPEEMQKAIEEFELTQQEMLERLERTLALLKKLQLEQAMEALVRQAEELAKKQEATNEKTESSDKDQLPQVSKDEDANLQSLNELKKKAAELQNLAKQAKADMREEFQKFSEAVEKTDADENMSDMSEALKSQKKDDASEQGKKALSKLLSMIDTMQQQLASMKGDDNDEMEKAMQAALDDANQLSQNQEHLRNEAALINSQSIMLREMAALQQDVKSSCNGLKNRLSELGKQSPFVAAELQSLVNSAVQNMELASEGFEAKKRSQAMKEQRSSMTKLNRASIRLRESLNSQKECNNGGQCDNKVKKLQGQCNKQNELNQQTQKQCNKPGGEGNPKFGENGRQAMKRLASEQASIRKSVEELNQEMGGSRQILGRLDDIAQEMKKVEEDLASGNVGQETTERQLKIYSRLLEASRSLQRRDFTEQRRAASPESGEFYMPPQLPAGMLDDGVNIEDRLRRYLSDDYPPQYEAQIKAYFKALLKAESELINPNAVDQPAQP
ncbi:MAG: hypothetical protein OEV49_05090 [candidate division Zixibacteria bacterium]|nr:hypothetical protein [candidate division Zixibacteria bacterium]MDH3936131.1 hypothetical protein [candidate division Zixibacteria bacterium]MDH4033278.1 hypothetical protein [candidate division Zixibacteria bacterium]